MGILQSNGRCQPLHYGKCRIVCFFDGISASFASILAFSFPSSSLKCSETSLEFFFHLNMRTPNLTLKKLKAHYAGFASCCFFKHAGCRKRSCRRMVDFGVSFSVSTYSQVLLTNITSATSCHSCCKKILCCAAASYSRIRRSSSCCSSSVSHRISSCRGRRSEDSDG